MNTKWEDIQANFNSSVRHFSMAVKIFHLNKFGEEDLEGYTAKMAFFHAMMCGYACFEEGLKRIMRDLSEEIPEGKDNQKNLLIKAFSGFDNIRPPIISDKVLELANALKLFSHYAEIAYDEFDHQKNKKAIEAAVDFCAIIIEELNQFEPHFIPMKLIEKVRANKLEICRIVVENGACNPRIFGSAARGEDHEESDLDILVDSVKGETSLLSLVRIQEQISILIGVKVDVFTPDCLKEYIRAEALKEAIPV